jgi:hypothetical protein
MGIAGRKLRHLPRSNRIDAVQRFRENEAHRLRQIVLVQTDYAIDRNENLLADLDNDGQAPKIGG